MKRVSLLLAVVLLLSVLPLGAGAAGTQLAFTQQPQDCTASPEEIPLSFPSRPWAIPLLPISGS